MLWRFLQGEVDAATALSWLLGVTIAITVHEFAHAKSADLAGDPTPRANGRVTLNPLAHYDVIGSTMFLLLGFGWAKPVPINPMAFRHPRRDATLVSLWGPLSNIIAAALMAIPIRLGVAGEYTAPLMFMIFANLVLAIFNLIPIPPLDGSHVLEGLLPVQTNRRLAAFYSRNMRWMLLIILLVMFSRVGNYVFAVILIPVGFLMRLLTGHGGLL